MKSSDTTEHHKDDKITVTVEQPPDGFWVSLKLIGRIPLPPEEVYEILTDPDNHKIFRSVKAHNNRKLIADNGHGRQEVEVEQVGLWRFGPFSGSFKVNLQVLQDRREGFMGFKLAPGRSTPFMKDFSGTWKIQPYNQDSLDEMVNFPGKHWGPFHNMRKALHHFEDKIAGKHADSSLVELRQCVAPAMVPPPPLDRVLKKVTLRQVRTVMDDLFKEADRRNARKAREKKDQEATDEKRALESHIKTI